MLATGPVELSWDTGPNAPSTVVLWIAGLFSGPIIFAALQSPIQNLPSNLPMRKET